MSSLDDVTRLSLQIRKRKNRRISAEFSLNHLLRGHHRGAEPHQVVTQRLHIGPVPHYIDCVDACTTCSKRGSQTDAESVLEAFDGQRAVAAGYTQFRLSHKYPTLESDTEARLAGRPDRRLCRAE